MVIYRHKKGFGGTTDRRVDHIEYDNKILWVCFDGGWIEKSDISLADCEEFVREGEWVRDIGWRKEKI
jgi:hypothetical protein